jgi:hypothetical protein
LKILEAILMNQVLEMHIKSTCNSNYGARKINLLLNIVVITCVLFIPSFSLAQDGFLPRIISDYGNVTVMEVTGNYNAKKADGTINSEPRQAITKEFLKTHKDGYDFLVIFSNFDFQMPDAEAKAFYLHVKNDIRGIGNPLSDNSSLFGSNGKLQGIIDMGNITTLTVDPIDPKFEDTLSILAHELMHRWGAYVKFKFTCLYAPIKNKNL